MLIVRPDLDYEIRQLELFKRMVEKGMFVLFAQSCIDNGDRLYHSPSPSNLLFTIIPNCSSRIGAEVQGRIQVKIRLRWLSC